MDLSRFACRLSFWFGLAGVSITALSGCGGGGGGSSTPPPTGNFVTPGTTPYVASDIASRAACQLNSHQSGRARWTVLIYINAANNLQPDSLTNVAQMASVGSNADLNIVIQWKQTATSNYFSGVAVNTTPSFVGTRRYRILPHNASDVNRIASGDTTVLDPDRLTDPSTNTINDAGTLTSDMGDYRVLSNFVQWGASNYPADHLAVVIWDHGSGALNVDNRSARIAARQAAARAVRQTQQKTRGLSEDVQTGSQIATQEIPLALASAPQRIDALIIDCSLQGTAEVAYDVRSSARVLVASEESPPAAGYPYDVWLGYLQNTASVGPCNAGQNLINDTILAYPNATNITQSMTDLSHMDAVATAINNFGSSLLGYSASQATMIRTARQSAQYFDFAEFKDLYHFADLIRTSSGVPSDLAQTAANVETSLLGSNGAILVSSHGQAKDSSGFGETYASGLSIFLPGPQTPSSVDSTVGFDPAWNLLGLAKVAPNWAAFLKAQLQ